LNASLVDWAFGLTKDVPLVDTEVMQKERSQYDSPTRGGRRWC